MMTNTIFAYGEKSLNVINITHLFKQIQQIKFAQLESSTLQSQYKFDLSENTMDKKLVKITIPNLQDTKNKSIKDLSNCFLLSRNVPSISVAINLIICLFPLCEQL